MKLHEYESYEKYVESQELGAHSFYGPGSIDMQWVQHPEIIFLWSDVIKPHFDKAGVVPLKGICHGAKLGKENKWFEEVTGMDFIGTDIAVDTNLEMKLLRWDFHKVKEEWEGSIDVIYTNALDHSYDPKLALTKWISCLSPDGICIVEWTECHTESHTNHVDPFGASLKEYGELAESAGGRLISGKVDDIWMTSNISKAFVVFSKK